MKVGKTIKKLRIESLGVNQGKFSELIGVSQKHLSQIENGRVKPSDELLKKIADVTGYSLGYLQLIALGDSIKEDKREQYKSVMMFFEDAFEEVTE